MPELPEVETVARDLRPLLLGKQISEVWWSGKKLRLPWNEGWCERMRGFRFCSVTRRAKWLVFSLEKGETERKLAKAHLVGHLGMTGQLTFEPGPAKASPSQDHIHLEFKLLNKRQSGNGDRDPKGIKEPVKQTVRETLQFRDIRRFGGFQWIEGEDGLDSFFQKHRVGPEPWDCDPQVWIENLRKTRRVIKAVLLDQTLISGVGNIYADECLHAAGIHPLKRGDSLTKNEAVLVLDQAARVMREAIRYRGTTIRNYVGGEKLEGENQHNLRAYGREGEDCLSCGRSIQRIVVGGRSSHFCPGCQKPPKSSSARNPGGLA